RGEPARADEGLIPARRSALTDCPLEPAFVAQVISLPSEADIAREIATDVDPDAVLAARQALRRAIAASLFDTLNDIYEQLTSRAPYSPDAEAAGRRALRNACLDLITATADAP